jgi:hypothetical protein
MAPAELTHAVVQLHPDDPHTNSEELGFGDEELNPWLLGAVM